MVRVISTFLFSALIAGCDTFIDVNCVFEGTVQLGSGVHIGPNCSIKDTTIADQAIVLANSVIEQSSIGSGAVVGPFARLRAGTDLAENSKVGNFVETKKSSIDKNSKVNHLSYIGDTIIGKNTNIGAGTITCNYDGRKKYKTKISKNVFVGSNSSLVAPVKLEAGSVIGAGSVITKNVKKNSLAISRAVQKEVKNYKRNKK